MALYSKEGAVKQVVHQLESEVLSRRYKLSLRLFQCIFGLLLLICIITGIALMFQTHPHETLSPLVIKVVAFNTDDEVV